MDIENFSTVFRTFLWTMGVKYFPIFHIKGNDAVVQMYIRGRGDLEVIEMRNYNVVNMITSSDLHPKSSEVLNFKNKKM